MHEAVAAARAGVSQQVSAQISSDLKMVEAQYDGKDESRARHTVRTSSSFEHLELIKTLGVMKGESSFVARVALDTERAIEVYTQELDVLRAELLRMKPVLERAVQERDASILLATRWSPVANLAKQRDKARVLGALGASVKVEMPAGLQTLVEKASSLRSRSKILMTVEGNAADLLERGVVGELSRLFEKRGCKLASISAKGDDVYAKARLRIVTRDHREFGLLWRYVGFELYVVDSQNGGPILHISALPEIVHGGGPSWPQADNDVVAKLRSKMDEKIGESMNDINCY